MLFSLIGSRHQLKSLLNLNVLMAIGMAIFLFSLELPKPIVQTLDMVGSMTAPLSMLIIGALLADTDLKKIFIGWDVYYGSLLRLLIIPLMTIVMLKPIGVDRDLLRICVVLTAMPAAANTVIFAERYGANSVLASRCGPVYYPVHRYHTLYYDADLIRGRNIS